MVYELKTVTYDGAPVRVEDYARIVYEGQRVFHDGVYVISRDDTITSGVTVIDNPIGSAEYYSIEDLMDKIDTIEVAGGTTQVIFPTETVGGEVGGEVGFQGRLVDEYGDEIIGYFPRRKKIV